MLAVINKFNDDEVTPMMLDDDAWFVTHAFNGNDELQFTFSDESGYYDILEEESKVLAIGLRGRSNRFVVKNIDSHDGVVTVNCDLDLYDWQRTIFDTYGGGSARTLEKVLQDVTPDGWSYSGQEQFGKSEVFQTGSREPIKAGTPLDVLDLASEVYGCVFNFDNIANHLYVIDTESYTPSGDFLSDEVNLKSVGYVGNTEGYATRLYPYGKRDDNGENPVTIESVNEGLPYVTNNEFSDDVICVGWSDERYTDPEHLKEAAIARLAEIAVPTRSYECDVSQLNRNIWLYMVLTMIDRKHRTRVDHQVVEWKEYGRPDLDVVTLSAVAPSLESLLKSADADDDAIYQYVNGIASDLTNAYEEAIENATDKITGNDGGYFQWIFDAEGRPVELVNLGDSMDINNAQKVWRWNQSGLGHSNNGYNGSYGLALLADGSINASMITTGTLNAVRIRAGVLQDVKGLNYWNLETGQFRLTSSATVGGETVQTIANNAATSKWNNTTQRDVFNKLTDNGAAQGVYMSGSQLYINGEYIKANTVSTNKIESYRGSSLYTTVGTTVAGNPGTSFVNRYGNYCDIESLSAVDDASGKTTGFGIATFDKPFLTASTFYNHVWLYPPTYANSYLEQPDQYFYIRRSGGAYSGNKNVINLQLNDNCGFWASDSRVKVGFNSTHYITVDLDGVQCRCGSKGFGWYNGSFSDSLVWS